MLLYTRLAPPKVPKKRSRAGCTYCKEKKKKCNEVRPQCARCAERGQECVYDAVKPRQRRKHDPEFDCRIQSSDPTVSSSRRAIQQELEEVGDLDRDQSDDSTDNSLGGSVTAIDTAMDNAFDPADVVGLSPTSQIVISPVGPLAYEAGFSGDEPADGDSRPAAGRGLALAYPRTLRQEMSRVALERDCPLRLEYLMPGFSEFTDRPNRRALVGHFCSVLSHLIVFKEEAGNPFQQLVLPLCHKSPAVMNAVFALAGAHLEYRGIDTPEKSVYFHNQAILDLSSVIERGGRVNKNELLAAIMLLVYYEVLVQRGRSNIVDGHLKGALTVLSTNHDDAEQPDSTRIFLERAFRFYDVIAALSFGTAPLSKAPTAGGLAPFPPLETATSPLSNVDTLLGMATTLWPFIHRLSNLSTLKRELEGAIAKNNASKASLLRAEFEKSSHAIESALKHWQPGLPSNFSLAGDAGEDTDGEVASERARLQSILNNALAYQHSALVYLYRTIYGYPRRHALVQRHAHVSLTHCVATVLNAGPMGALLWPLFVAACEAVSLGDRDLARQAFLAIGRRQGMINIERAWLVAQEVWKRADMMDEGAQVNLAGGRAGRAGYKGHDLWRKVSDEMGITIIFG